MQRITTKSTKSEIFEAYKALQERPTTWQDAAALVASTARTVGTELVALVRDTYNAGRLARQWVDGALDELVVPSRCSHVSS